MQVLGRRETILRVTEGRSPSHYNVSGGFNMCHAMICTALTESTLLADHEVVDVDGFVFKRKRRMPLSESANVLDEQAKRIKTCEKDKAWNHLQPRDQVKVCKRTHALSPAYNW